MKARLAITSDWLRFFDLFMVCVMRFGLFYVVLVFYEFFEELMLFNLAVKLVINLEIFVDFYKFFCILDPIQIIYFIINFNLL